LSRPQKQTVDYFPHDSDASSSKTIFILETEFGNDGYAFWFKLLELLANSQGHVYDVRNPAAWRFLLARTRVSSDLAERILQTLAELEAIDSELWQSQRMLWVQHLVDNVTDAYRNRKSSVPSRPSSNSQKPMVPEDSDVRNPPLAHVSNSENPQTKLNKTKLNKTIHARFEIFWKAYPKKRSKGQAEKAFTKVKPDEQLLATMLATIERAKKSEGWLKDGGQFIPYPATWLNRKCWEDEFQETKGGRGEQRGKGVRPKPAQERRRGPLTRIPGDKEPEG